MKYLWIGISLLLCIKEVLPLATDYLESFPLIDDYEYMLQVTNTLLKKYNDYINEDVNNEVQKKLKKDEFVTSFEALYNDASRRLYGMITKNDSKTLQNEVTRRNGNDYFKSKTFFDQLLKSFEDICNVKMSYLVLLGDIDSAKKEKSFKQKALGEIKGITENVLKYLKEEAWKTQFVIDTNSFLLNNVNAYDVQTKLMTTLAKKYPFRNWLVVVYHRTLSSKYCATSPPLSVFSAGEGRSLLVIQTAKDSKWDKNAAVSKINKAAASRYTWFCTNKAPAIFEEVTSDCRSDKIPFLGVFMIVPHALGNLPAHATSAPNRLATRIVKRGMLTGICRRYYTMLIFG